MFDSIFSILVLVFLSYAWEKIRDISKISLISYNIINVVMIYHLDTICLSVFLLNIIIQRITKIFPCFAANSVSLTAF